MVSRHNVSECSRISVAVARALQIQSTDWIRLGFVPVMILASFVLVSAQTDSIYRLAAGTRIRLKMDVEINSRVASVGDTFTAAVSKPVVNRDATVLPVGTLIEGRVANVSSAGLGARDGKLDLVFETVRLSSEVTRPMDGILVTRPHHRSPRVIKGLAIMGGTIAGAVLGAVARSAGGAMIGAGVGAGAGTAVAMLRKGKDMTIGRDEEFEIVLRSDVLLPVLDY